MSDYVKELLAAERRGRTLALLERPEPGDAWTITVGGGPDACALMAAARWAKRFGAEVRLALPATADALPAWQSLAESCRLQNIVVPPDADFPEPNVLVIAEEGDEWEIRGLPDPDAAWQTGLAESWRMCGPVGPDSPRLTTVQCRAVDAKAIKQFGVPGVCLMENAAVAAVAVAMDMLAGPRSRPVLVAAGGGNNGGDGFAVARGLDSLGVRVEVALLKPAESLKGDALANYRLLSEISTVRIHHLSDRPAALEPLLRNAGLVIDSLLGTGFQGGLSDPFRHAIDAINMAGKPVLGLDLPSGLDSETGQVAEAAIACERTVTFAAVKPGLESGVAEKYTGALHIGDIGAPAATLVD